MTPTDKPVGTKIGCILQKPYPRFRKVFDFL